MYRYVKIDDVIQINKHRTDGYGYLDILRFDGGMVVKRYNEEVHHDISVDINLEPDLLTGEDNPKKVSVFNRPVSELVFFQHPNGWQVNTDGPTIERRSRIEKFAEILGSYGVDSLIKRGRSLRSSFFE